MRALDLFSCIGCHAIGFDRAGIETVGFCEINPFRRAELNRRFPGRTVHVDVSDFYAEGIPYADVVIGGPPCQKTSVASAIHGKRTGASLWPYMLQIGLTARAEWFVVEQPPGNAAWEAEVSKDLSRAGYHVARFEFGACDIGAPYIRRRVFLVACTSLSGLEIARQSLPRAIDETKRAADARGDWDPDQLASLPVDARAADEFGGGARSRERLEWIEALGDSNPPHMAEAIGRAIMVATRAQPGISRENPGYNLGFGPSLSSQGRGVGEPAVWRGRRNASDQWVYFDHNPGGSEEGREIQPLYATPPAPGAADRAAVIEWQPIETVPKDQEVEVRGLWKLRGDGVVFTHWRAPANTGETGA